VFDHSRFEELASLAAIRELSPEERQEFENHQKTCAKCRSIVATTSATASFAFLAGVPKDEDASHSERHQRLRANISRRLPVVVPARFSPRFTGLVAAGVALAFVAGAGVGGAVGLQRGRQPGLAVNTPIVADKPPVSAVPDQPALAQSETRKLQSAVADLQKQIELARSQYTALQDKLAASDQHAAELDRKLATVEKQSGTHAQETTEARNELNAARTELSQAKESISASQATINSLQYRIAERDSRLTEVSASVEREREMLSADREIRDIMGARDLHIVDVIDRDGKGRARQAFGRAFYTQGKSLIFYAFDLPAKNTADGKFVYAAWGSNSNNLTNKGAHSLGIFYNDDQSQHRWAMKFEDPKILDEIDTVFVTLEPAGKPFANPTGKPILEAYFGTPPNHP
jgi:hypothetical protein